MSNTIKCPACDFPNAIVKTNAKGAMSVSCSVCGYQGFARSPKSSAALQAKLTAGKPADRPAGSNDDILDKL